MPLHTERLTYLLERYAADNCTRQEWLELLETIREAGSDPGLHQALEKIWMETTGETGLPPIDKEGIFQRIVSVRQENLFNGDQKSQSNGDEAWAAGGGETIDAGEAVDAEEAPVRRLRRPRVMAVAASVALLILAGGALYGVRRLFQDRENVPVAHAPKTNVFKNDIAPGKNKAVLTLASGATIVLDSAQNGSLAQQGHTLILKLSNGQLAYRQAAGSARQPVPVHSGSVEYNTISVPRGGQYQLVLSDGTKVWMNSSSSLRFPAAFAGGDRTVALEGEAYFEVASDKQHPFHVTLANNRTVDVLGTHFNVMAYADENAVQTTLLEGAVRVSGTTLAPGEQAEWKPDGTIRVKKGVDVAAAVAWKEGLFSFRDADIQSVMRQLVRWYNIEVVYEPLPVKSHFYAKIPRNTNISTVLQALTLTGGMHFGVEGKQVTVYP